MPKYIKKLTDEQRAAMPAFAQKWINHGLKTGATDWATFDKNMPICYEKAGIPYPIRVVRVSSPLIGALAAAVANGIREKRRIHDAVGGAVGDAVRDAVRDAINMAHKFEVSLSWHPWLGGQFWVGYGYYWRFGVAAVNFLMDTCGLELATDMAERAIAYRKVCESVNYIWPNRDFVMVCARPTRIEKDDQNRLHSTSDMAIKYPDGWGLYYIHGVRFDSVELWRNVASGALSAAEVFAIANMEQRRVAYDIMDKAKMAELPGLQILDNITDDGYGYPMRIVSFQLPGIKAPFMYLNCFCPSGGREYYVETRESDCWKAKAASFGLDNVEWESEF